jgi:hypothetical protein
MAIIAGIKSAVETIGETRFLKNAGRNSNNKTIVAASKIDIQRPTVIFKSVYSTFW